MIIHEALYKDYIAMRYYNKMYPSRRFDRVVAGKKWHQDKKIDKKLLAKVIDTIVTEQKKLLK